MRHIISYVSTASSNLTNSNIQELFSFVEKFNIESNITGILMYSDGNFFQILEGDKEKVLLLFEKIKKDPRHYNIIKMLDKQIEVPSFSTYGSSFITILSNNPYNQDLNMFLQKEKEKNAEHYQSTSYIVQKFLQIA
ncbi:BLUF domain-containing protein [Aquimarina pacifica]|uniref:BLUF domain-containing protein n=1 Tax=Aquimarina pacifica TaxID=1296415 RepID=UPI00046F389A|nr:BLUF domain-containing protein [Aquimarina pacifica]